MGIAAADYRFLWAIIGLPGSENDACTFKASHLYSDIMRGNALPDIKKVLTVQSQREVQLPPVLLRDFAFLHHYWLQKPFANTVLSEKQSHFNYCLGRARMVTKCTFGQLKGRWRLLYQKSEVSQHSLKMILLACIVLHNICTEKKDHINHSLDLTFDENNNKRKLSEDIIEET